MLNRRLISFNSLIHYRLKSLESLQYYSQIYLQVPLQVSQGSELPAEDFRRHADPLVLLVLTQEDGDLLPEPKVSLRRWVSQLQEESEGGRRRGQIREGE